MRRVRAIIRKEFLHILRDPRSLLILFVMPILMMILFGYAVRLDIRHIPLRIVDLDGTPASRELIRSFRHCGYFRITGMGAEPVDADRIFRNREALGILTVPRDFEKSLMQTVPIPVQFVSDASESNTATIAGQYAEQIVILFMFDRFRDAVRPPDLRSIILFNPQLESTHFIVPGLVAILFMMICALLTSVTIAREKETGTMEQILVSPVRAREIIIGKVLPYIVLSGVIGLIVLVFSREWFEVPFRGNPLHMLWISLVYILCSLSVGILISTRVKTMQVAMMLALVITMLPSVMLSGFMFPIASMPPVIQWISRIVPARYYLIVIRNIMLKGSALGALKMQIVSLGILTLVLLLISIRRFKASLE